MIKNWYVTGDTHGGMATITRVSNIQRNMPESYKPEETGIIILGDAGLNFYLNDTDKKYKKMLNSMGFYIYCVRGNHEQRPELIPSMIMVEDTEVDNTVYMEEAFPHIRYLVDGNEYQFGDYTALVIGGAYSIDKEWRLLRAGYSLEDESIANPKVCGWFKNEQLSYHERKYISEAVCGKHYDFVFTHTTAMSWEPTDLFLSGIDQTKVDKTMEIWLDHLKDNFSWDVWCFGHYHADRVERPCVEQFYYEYEELDQIWARWDDYKSKNTLDWWIPKSPVMEDIVNGKTA